MNLEPTVLGMDSLHLSYFFVSRRGDTGHAWFWTSLHWVATLAFVGGAVIGFALHAELKDRIPPNPDAIRALHITWICSGSAAGIFVLRRRMLWLLD